jgi:hypothetical protein
MSTAPAMVRASEATPDDFWSQRHSASELRERLRSALMDDLSDRGLRVQAVAADALGFQPLQHSPAEILAMVDELVAQVRREERIGRVIQGGADER